MGITVITIKLVLIFALVATEIKLISESFLIKRFRILVIYKDTVFITEVFNIMKKISWIYRISIELFILWGCFEWRAGIIGQFVVKIIKRFWGKMQKVIFMISPYARKWMNDTDVAKWMHYYSIALILLAIYFLILFLCDKNKANRLRVSITILFCDSYIGLGLAKAMTCLELTNIYLVMSIFIGVAVLIHIPLLLVYYDKTQ